MFSFRDWSREWIIGGRNRGASTPWPLLNIRPLHRNVIFVIENQFSLAKWLSLHLATSSTSGVDGKASHPPWALQLHNFQWHTAFRSVHLSGRYFLKFFLGGMPQALGLAKACIVGGWLCKLCNQANTLSVSTLNSAVMVMILKDPPWKLSQPPPQFISASVPVSINVYVHICLYVHVYMHACMHMCMCMGICKSVYMCKWAYKHVCMHMYVHVYLQWTTIGWLSLCCCLLTTWPIRSIMPAPVLGEPCSGHPV